MDFLHQKLDFVENEKEAYLIIYFILATFIEGMLMKEVVGALICHRKIVESFIAVLNFDIFVSMVEENLLVLFVTILC